jgi:hypothetical protein
LSKIGARPDACKGSGKSRSFIHLLKVSALIPMIAHTRSREMTSSIPNDIMFPLAIKALLIVKKPLSGALVQKTKLAQETHTKYKVAQFFDNLTMLAFTALCKRNLSITYCFY